MRLWIPADFVDEWTPPGRPHPDNWLGETLHGGTAVVESDGDDVSALEDGTTVVFVPVQDHGSFTLTVLPDGTLKPSSRCPHTIDMFDPDYRPEPRGIPATANAFFDEDTETFAEFPEQFAAAYAEYVEPDEEADVTVKVSTWGDKTSFVFRAGRFHEVGLAALSLYERT